MSRRILFVCIDNSNRSQMAEAAESYREMRDLIERKVKELLAHL